jgi:hypothetical protein
LSLAPRDSGSYCVASLPLLDLGVAQVFVVTRPETGGDTSEYMVLFLTSISPVSSMVLGRHQRQRVTMRHASPPSHILDGSRRLDVAKALFSHPTMADGIRMAKSISTSKRNQHYAPSYCSCSSAAALDAARPLSCAYSSASASLPAGTFLRLQ